MIKFFRKIRKKLLEQNRVSKYLLYAIGEIVLVVIGILIALQINNWNEIRKEKALEKELINLLISDLEEKREEHITDFTYAENVIKRFQKLTDTWDNEGKLDTTNIKGNLRMLAMDIFFQNENSPIYASLSSSNFWKQLPDTLTKQIDDVYRIQLKRVGIAFDKFTEYGTHCRLNFLTPNDLMDLDRDTNIILKNLEPVEKEFILKSKLYVNGGNRLISRLKSSADKIEDLIKKLQKYNQTK